MKVVILAGGKGTRISEESVNKPKPMVKIGDLPILVHIMKIYSYYGHNDFIICCGYKKEIIKNYFEYNSSTKTFKNKLLNTNWNIKCVDTGLETSTGGRLLKIKKLFSRNENFFATYGDGLADVDIDKLYNFHLANKKLVTVTAVNPPSRFGLINFKKNSNVVDQFNEKPNVKNDWINGGFFVINSKALQFIPNFKEPWESYPLQTLTEKNQLIAFKHKGFWQPMDTLREKQILNYLYIQNKAAWKKW